MRRALVLVLFAGVLAGCSGDTEEGDGGLAAPDRVTAVSNVLQLRAAFNEDAGSRGSC